MTQTQIKLYNSLGEQVNHSNLAEFPIPPNDALALKFQDEVDEGRWVTDESDLARLKRADAPLSYTESGLAMLGVTQARTYTYVVRTDAVMQEVNATDIDEAAKLFADGEFPGKGIEDVSGLFAHIEQIGDGAWCWIESDSAPDGARQNFNC